MEIPNLSSTYSGFLVFIFSNAKKPKQETNSQLRRSRIVHLGLQRPVPPPVSILDTLGGRA